MLKSLAIAAILFASPAIAHPSCLATKQPPNVIEPTVAYQLFNLPRAKVHAMCGDHGGRDVTACTYQSAKGWTIIVSDDLSVSEYACVVRYEKSHLAPNYWGDPTIENPGTIRWLANQK